MTGKFATPNWLLTNPSTTVEYFQWLIISSEDENTLYSTLRFVAVHGGHQPCTDPSNTNEVIISAIRGQVFYEEFRLCIDEVMIWEPYIVNGSAIVQVDFVTVDPVNYGFIAEFEIGKFSYLYSTG